MAPVKFEVELISGRTMQVTGEHVSGSPEKPITAGQLRDKVVDCLTYNQSSVDPDVLVSAVKNLPEATSLREILALLGQK